MTQPPCNAIAPKMIAILVVATVLGFVFNSLSPLGAHSDSASDSTLIVRATNVGTATHGLSGSAASSVPTKGYHNETLSIRLENASGPVAASALASPAPATAATPATRPNPASPIREVTWAEVKTSLGKGDMLVIDTRPASNFQAGHIPGAISIPSATTDLNLAVTMERYPKTLPITVYCASTSCGVSHAFAERLVRMGFSDVRDMRGGMAEYLQSEKPTAATPTK